MEPWEVRALFALAILAVLIGVHALTRLPRRLHVWRDEGLERPWGRAVGEGLRFGVLWAMAAALAAVVSYPSQESDTAGAAGALLAIVGGLGIGSYAFALACVTLVGFFRLNPGEAGAPWPRHGLVTGLVVSATWLLLCPSPVLLLGEAEPSIPHLAALLVGVALYSVAVATGVFWRARQSSSAGRSTADRTVIRNLIIQKEEGTNRT